MTDRSTSTEAYLKYLDEKTEALDDLILGLFRDSPLLGPTMKTYGRRYRLIREFVEKTEEIESMQGSTPA